MLFLAGFAVLAAGALFYVLERPADSALFLPPALSLNDGHGHLPPALGGALPTFLHTLAFPLMTAALLPPTIRARFGGCGAWAAIETMFEAAQHPLVAKTFGAGMAGIFDPLDVIAALGGAATAFLLMRTGAPARRAGAEPTRR